MNNHDELIQKTQAKTKVREMFFMYKGMHKNESTNELLLGRPVPSHRNIGGLAYK